MAIGVTFPFQLATGSLGYVELTNELESAISSNVKALLLTNWGERPMHSDLGCNLREFIFEPKTPQLQSRIFDRIQSQLQKWMPFLVIQQMSLVFSDEDPSLPDEAFKVNLTLAFGADVRVRVSQSITR